jgi:hypothetical protein
LVIRIDDDCNDHVCHILTKLPLKIIFSPHIRRRFGEYGGMAAGQGGHHHAHARMAAGQGGKIDFVFILN